MTEDPLPLATTLRAAGEIVAAKIADSEIVVGEHAEVLAALHGLDSATTPVHDMLAECLGLIDGDGRCSECGRLVAWGMWRSQSHKDGPGCLTAIPGVGLVVWVSWAVRHPTGVPVLGNVIVRWRRRRVDPTRNGHRPAH